MKLVLDTFCEVYDLLQPYATAEFWELNYHDIIPGAVYLVSREQMNLHRSRWRELVESGTIKMILSNPAEGSETLKTQCEFRHGIADLVQQGRILLISGGEIEAGWPYLLYENFLPKILDYEENKAAQQRTSEIYTRLDKPYKFLFLNGRMRHHRRYLLELFQQTGLLDSALWTNLDSRATSFYPFVLEGRPAEYNQVGVSFPVQQLPRHYEVERYHPQFDQPPADTNRDLYLKYHMFNDEWGDVYINPEPYIDTYFSLVTETVFEYPYSFRTEKLWKPVCMGHPFVVAANQGYYRDLHALGFRTFGHLIDESFDAISNVQDRIDRISDIVHTLAREPGEFLLACEETCKYNQQHLAVMREQVRREFPQRFFQFIEQYFNERP